MEHPVSTRAVIWARVLVLAGILLAWYWVLPLFFAQEDFNVLLRARTLGWGAWMPISGLVRPVFLGPWLQGQLLFFDLRPLPWHVVPLALLCVNTMLVWALLTRLGASLVGTALGALAYGTASWHFQGTAWVAGSISELAAMFVLLGGVCAANQKWARYRGALCGAALVLGVLTYDAAIALAVIVPAIRLYRRGSVGAAIRDSGTTLALGAGYVGWRLLAQAEAPALSTNGLYQIHLGLNVLQNAALAGLVLSHPVWVAYGWRKGLLWQAAGQWLGAGLLLLVLCVAVGMGLRLWKDVKDGGRPVCCLVGAAWLLAGIVPTLPLTSFYPGRLAVAGCAVPLIVAGVWPPQGYATKASWLVACALLIGGVLGARAAGRIDTLLILPKQELAERIVTDIAAFHREHPDVSAVSVPVLQEEQGLAAAATYWGDAVRLFFPELRLVTDLSAETEPVILLQVRQGHLVPARVLTPHIEGGP